jgi:hypothetical protein
VAILVLLAKAKYLGVRRWPFAARNATVPSPTTVPAQENFPLDAIFRLEDELSMLSMNADKLYGFVDGDEKPKIPSPAAFLRTLNTVRRQMEGAKNTGEFSEYLAPFQDFNFKKQVTPFGFHKINVALRELDETLLSRYESKDKDWRPRALAALARARRELIAVCEPASEGPEPDIGGNTSAA